MKIGPYRFLNSLALAPMAGVTDRPFRQRRNALRIAGIAEDAGIAALSLHGRTRADAYRGEAEYATVRAVKQAVRIPVIANGDIDSPFKAREVLERTGADGIMIGRAAQGRPWIFREIQHFLESGTLLPPPCVDEARAIMLGHIAALHGFYGAYLGVRVARKHIGWYLAERPNGAPMRRRLMGVENAADQLGLIDGYFAAARAAWNRSQ